MVSPYSGTDAAGHPGQRHSKGKGIVQFPALDPEGGMSVRELFIPNSTPSMAGAKKSHLRPNWSPGYDR